MLWSTGGIRVFDTYECDDSRQIPIRSVSILQSSFFNGEQPTINLFLPFKSFITAEYAPLKLGILVEE